LSVPYEELKARDTEVYFEFLETDDPLTEEDRLNLKNVSRSKKRIGKQLKEIREKGKKAGGKK
jgi:predicted transcriptional regulator